ncbi:2-dehydro-3-deoxygalactonokinase [Aquicoccus porphyridii]|uniref:2-dehydro-3-deoxygalactonokinase n=2 Tax=Aquicoccus porphyridii TaxID=1852029 RepID=A0A5A9Z8C6_9RHOB|nr:2-dehydro-3-deoxygalactonokinase [Aquicoccus porphyridii]RAI52315.1 2-dehydro-3-deoxygalactonokinase [Rhodobacteraceae bacterium AsT-22]
MQMSDKVPCPALGSGDVVQDKPRGRLDADARMAVAGHAVAHPNWDGVICLPGLRSHWVHLSAGEIVSFQSFLTARLAHALDAGERADADALADTMTRPERLAQQLDSAELGGDRDALLGHLLGAEMAAARPYWLGQQVIVMGDDGLADGYANALGAQGVPVERVGRAAMEDAGRRAL